MRVSLTTSQTGYIADTASAPSCDSAWVQCHYRPIYRFPAAGSFSPTSFSSIPSLARLSSSLPSREQELLLKEPPQARESLLHPYWGYFGLIRDLQRVRRTKRQPPPPKYEIFFSYETPMLSDPQYAERSPGVLHQASGLDRSRSS
jgi:hypothetical protein